MYLSRYSNNIIYVFHLNLGAACTFVAGETGEFNLIFHPDNMTLISREVAKGICQLNDINFFTSFCIHRQLVSSIFVPGLQIFCLRALRKFNFFSAKKKPHEILFLIVHKRNAIGQVWYYNYCPYNVTVVVTPNGQASWEAASLDAQG